MTDITQSQCITPTTPNYKAGNINKSGNINSQKKLSWLMKMGAAIGNLPQVTGTTIANMQKFNSKADIFQKDARQFLEREDSILKNDKFKRLQTLGTSETKTATVDEKPLKQTLAELAATHSTLTQINTHSTLTQMIAYYSDYNNSPMDEASILAMASQVSNAMVELSYNVAVSLTKLTQSFQKVTDMLASLQKILAYVQGYFTAAIACHNSNSNNKSNQMATWDFGSGDEESTNFSGGTAGETWEHNVHLDSSGNVYLTGLQIPNNVAQFFPGGNIDESNIDNLLNTVSTSLSAILPDSASFAATNAGAEFNSSTIQTFIDNCGTKIKSVNNLLSTYTNQIETAQNAAQQGLSFFSSINNIMNQLIQKLF